MTTPHEIEIYVRFSETDAMGHINNVSYLIYFEEARTKFFDELSNKEYLPDKFILASVKCDYLSQAYAAQILKVETMVSRIGTKSFTVDHLLTVKETGRVIARASAVLVSFDYNEQQTIPIPQVIRENLECRLVTN